MQGDGVLLKLFMPQVWFGLHWNLNRNYFLPPPMIIAQVANKKNHCTGGTKPSARGISRELGKMSERWKKCFIRYRTEKCRNLCWSTSLIQMYFEYSSFLSKKICFEIHVKYINVLVHRDSRHCIARCTSRSRD